jgi:hypothetical protein
MKWFLAICLYFLCVNGGVAGGVWCVVGSREAQDAIGVLKDWRAGEGGGFEVRTVDGMAAVPAGVDYVLILGDETAVPPAKMPFYRWRSVQAETYATDIGVVERASVGRIPTNVPDLLRLVAEKIVGYEKMPPKLADLNLAIWMGTSAAGKAVDEVATFAMQRAISSQGPGWAQSWMIMGNPQDTFSAHGNNQAQLFNQRMAGGGAFSLFMGHGSRGGFYSYDWGKKWIGYGRNHVDTGAREASAPAIIFACDCGDYSTEEESLAEAMLFVAGGPVAAIAATTESHPLTNYYSGRALLDVLKLGAHERLGPFWDAVQRGAFERREVWAELTLSGVEGMLENKLNLDRLKEDHARMYVLHGDPATKLRVPRALEAKWEKRGENEWAWTVTKPSGFVKGELVVEHRGIARDVARALPNGAGAEESLRLFEARNRSLEFVEVERREFVDAWSGVARERGAWRFLVFGEREVFAVGEEF